MYLLIATLFAFISSPFFLPKTIYILNYCRKKGKNNLSKDEKEKLNHFIFCGIVESVIALFLNFIILLIFKISLFSIMIIMAMILASKLAFYSIIKLDNYFDITKKQNIINNIFLISLMVICIIILYIFLLDLIKIFNTELETPKSLENYAKENGFMLIEDSKALILSNESDSKVVIINNDLYYFSLISNSNQTDTIVVDKSNLDNSFELSFKSSNTYVDEISNKFGKNHFYSGFNISSICYLVNENTIYKVWAILEKDPKTNNFYIYKYILEDLKNNTINEFKEGNN